MTKISIGQYLINRLKELNIDTIFGCPGDYNMPLLDIIEDDKDMTWGNDANELNASYSADGYARVRGAGAVVTTFGVGELSAANGTAGSYSEMIPVLHIVGAPNTKSQAEGAILHHTLGNGNFRVFQEMFANITVANSMINETNAFSEIDRVIKKMCLSRRPAYLGIPIDLVTKELDAGDIKPLDLSLPPNPPNTQKAALKAVLDAIEKAKNPIIMVDACTLRNNLTREAREFADKTGFPTYVAPMGKGAVDESAEHYRGCYSGSVSLKEIAKEVRDSDLILEIGSVQSDFNTGGFSYELDQDKIIAFHTFATIVCRATYEKVGMSEFLPLVIKNLPEKKRPFTLGPRAQPNPPDNGTEITHSYFWNKMPDYMPPRSVVIAETGTAEFGVFNMRAPKDSTFITQVLWGSIGYTVGACYGAAMADKSRQVFLFVGDGSFQMTVQEVSVMIHQGATPVIFLLNNDGYLIEKLIHGLHRDYNNYQMWKYADTIEYFGGNMEHNHKFPRHAKIGVQSKVSTRQEFEAAMEKVGQQPGHIHFLEVIMPRFDAPRELLLQVDTSENR
ncbi:thiamine diphosphate-binding protein [Radiomyces spectabilis]|uniref:thiamine diphosphate-binding protein n=1 Tax=Radiomyces spectabilis TaxID=64574 RepID=UPI002220A957|nr:thiamine diphosphate-binding protein [Radiomyces spectabilis]KAI8381331.1 thiamine diphosphate-binding protein [Radiomyces spectabilis]